MTITNVIIKTPDRKRDWGVNDIIPGRDGWEFGDLEKAVSWYLTLGRASPACGGLTVGDVGTVSIVKIVSLSSCRKTKSQEGNKHSVPEQQSCQCFGFLHANVYFTKVDMSLNKRNQT